MSVFQELYDSEINFTISVLWEGGFDVKLGDNLNGFDAEATLARWSDVESWMTQTPTRLHPFRNLQGTSVNQEAAPPRFQNSGAAIFGKRQPQTRADCTLSNISAEWLSSCIPKGRFSLLPCPGMVSADSMDRKESEGMRLLVRRESEEGTVWHSVEERRAQYDGYALCGAKPAQDWSAEDGIAVTCLRCLRIRAVISA